MKKISQEKIDKAIELYKSGYSLNKIGKELCIDPYGTLSRRLKAVNIKIINRQNNTYQSNHNYFEEIDTQINHIG